MSPDQPPAGLHHDPDERVTRILDRTGALLPREFGRYHILQLVRQGPEGAVHLALDTTLDRQVLLKVPPLAAEDPAAVERFLRSARAAAALSHPNLCPVLDAGQHLGIAYLTMPVLEGQPLVAVLAERGPWPVTEAADLVRKLALALESAHRKGVFHRDLTPTCVLLTPTGEPIITDFGLARQEGSARLTVAGQVLGTPGYLAPEMLTGKIDQDSPARDIYSLGVLLYELLTGKLPFGRTMREVLVQQGGGRDPLPPSGHRPEVAGEPDAICLKALARKPENRYRGMADFAEAIGHWLRPSDPPAEARGISKEKAEDEKAPRLLPAAPALPPAVPLREEPAPIPLPRRRWRPVFLASGVFLAVSLVAFLVFRSERLEEGSPPILPGKEPPAAALEDPEPWRVRMREHVKLEEWDQVVAASSEVIKRKPDEADAWYERGRASVQLRRFDQAVADCTEAIRLKPLFGEAYLQRGYAHAEKKDHDQALANFGEVLRVVPAREQAALRQLRHQAYCSRAAVYREKGMIDLVIADTTKAIASQRCLRSLNNRAWAFLQKKDHDQAIADFVEVVRLDPKSASAYNSLAWLHAVCPTKEVRNGQKAVEYAKKGCELTSWKDAQLLNTLAAACAEAGQFEQAVQWQKKALEDPGFQATHGEGARQRLQLYEQRQPFREN